jgi:hypothetical protein|tara:strand:+ start:435 stop:623 length:189 start_codon:yes stop_codon:yes gene_type:complete
MTLQYEEQFIKWEEHPSDEMNDEISDMSFCQDFVKLHKTDTGCFHAFSVGEKYLTLQPPSPQ